MKRITLFTCLFALVVFSYSYSQTKKNAYLQIDYIKAKAGQTDNFEELVTSEWKALYKKHVDTSKITGWYFYEIHYPGGNGSDYNYAVITTYNNMDPVLNIDDVMDKELTYTGSGGEMIATKQYSELWKTEAEIMSISDTRLGKIMVMNYMQVAPGKGAEYLTLENDMARPLHQERINKGEMHSWRTYSLIQPGGLSYGYNFATADYFEHLRDVEFGFTNELIKSVMPGTNINEMFDAIYATREIVKFELWVLVDYAE